MNSSADRRKSVTALSDTTAAAHDCDSVCSTLSDCSLIHCRRSFHRRPRGRSRPAPAPQLSPPLPPPPSPSALATPRQPSLSPPLPTPPPSAWCHDSDSRVADFKIGASATDNFNVDDNDLDAVSSLSGASSLSRLSDDRASYRTTVMRQFETELSRLELAVAQRIRACGGRPGAGDSANPAAGGGVYSVVKSGCLSLLLSRVLPPILERFEQRLIGSLLSAGLLSAEQAQRPLSDATSETIVSGPQPPPKPAPRRKRNSALPPAPTDCSTAVFKQPEQPCALQHRVASPYFVVNSSYRHYHQPPLTVRNNSSLSKTSVTPPLPPQRQPPPSPLRPPLNHQQQHALISVSPAKATGSAALRDPLQDVPSSPRYRSRSDTAATTATTSLCDIVHAFTVPDSPALRQILTDPADRKVKSISQRYGCFIGVFQRNSKRPSRLSLHRVVVRAPGEKALRMCLNALDSGLGWDLSSQFVKKSGTTLSVGSSSAVLPK